MIYYVIRSDTKAANPWQMVSPNPPSLTLRIVSLCATVIFVALIAGKFRNEVATEDNRYISAVKRHQASAKRGALNSVKNGSNTDIVSRKLTGDADLCSSQWTDEKLVGRCWGLMTSTQHPSVKGTTDDRIILNADECKQLCCKMAGKCVVWQYWEATQICKVGKHVRVGSESGSSPRWCEPSPPQKWVGAKRDMIANPLNQSQSLRQLDCKWIGQQPGQCFGLGPERRDKSSSRLTAQECALGCCNEANCWIWQHLPDRGCFYNTDKRNEEPFCDQYVGNYIGGRKKTK